MDIQLRRHHGNDIIAKLFQEATEMTVEETRLAVSFTKGRTNLETKLTMDAFSQLEKILATLQSNGILRSGPICFHYRKPEPFFSIKPTLGMARPQSLIDLDCFLLEPHVIKRYVPRDQLKEIIHSPNIYPKSRSSKRIAQIQLARSHLNYRKLAQMAAESLLDGTYKRHLRNPKHLFYFHRQDKEPKSLFYQMDNYRFEPKPRNSQFMRWTIPDEYSVKQNAYAFIPDQPGCKIVSTTRIRSIF